MVGHCPMSDCYWQPFWGEGSKSGSLQYISFVSCYLLDVAKEIEHQKAFWCEKGQEIESHFKELYQPTQLAPVSKGRKGGMSKKLPQKEENKELSSYAGNLTKEFLVKVSLLDLSPLLSFSFLGFVSYLYPLSLLIHSSNANMSSLIGVTGHRDSPTSVT